MRNSILVCTLISFFISCSEAKNEKKVVNDQFKPRGAVEFTINGLDNLQNVNMVNFPAIGQTVDNNESDVGKTFYVSDSEIECTYSELKETKTVVGFNSQSIVIQVDSTYSQPDKSSCPATISEMTAKEAQAKFYNDSYSIALGEVLARLESSCVNKCSVSFSGIDSDYQASIEGRFRIEETGKEADVRAVGFVNLKYPWLEAFKSMRSSKKMEKSSLNTSIITSSYKKTLEQYDINLENFLLGNEFNDFDMKIDPKRTLSGIEIKSERDTLFAGSTLNIPCDYNETTTLVNTIRLDSKDYGHGVYQINRELLNERELDLVEMAECSKSVKSKEFVIGKIQMTSESFSMSTNMNDHMTTYTIVE